MTFFTVVLRGLWRRPLRTGLTLAGISIGIAAVVALVGMSRGFEKGWQVGLKARGTDIEITRLNSSHTVISYAVFCLKKKNNVTLRHTAKELHHDTRLTLDAQFLRRHHNPPGQRA